MVKRGFWLKKIEAGLKRRSILWLSGVRRTGKTFLCKSIEDAVYFDMDLPGHRSVVDGVESFLAGMKGRTVVIDEIHRLGNPSELLKVAADHFPEVKVIATGSSSLGASRKFRDTLTGRKTEILLTPMLCRDLDDFGNTGLAHRFLRGGLPPMFMAEAPPKEEFQEWFDSFWAKDIAELFRLESKYSFTKFAELLMAQSGSIFEATRFARPCEVNRSTISNYLGVLEATFIVSIIRPFSTHRPTEITSAPKVYGFDTGFVCFFKGIDALRADDMGLMWEHFVLNELCGNLQTRKINYYRDKQGHEVDFVIARAGRPPIAIECKWSADNADLKNLKHFRKHYPEGENYIVCSDVKRSFTRIYDGLTVNFVGLPDLIAGLSAGD
ncbi:MAG TPA: DUF4143 domain-containing protein [Acidobacteriota bacterium]|nr:DUF4143 domain-containing protein [Acidobacteriota bacterium]HQO19031.1 DUF4143 domain-containing protein [Acidobacteriota bacterium]HQQ45924.1 DUF4143 domain-containing protein [Acidobacteriota bacterium]